MIVTYYLNEKVVSSRTYVCPRRVEDLGAWWKAVQKTILELRGVPQPVEVVISVEKIIWKWDVGANSYGVRIDRKRRF